MSIKTIFIVFFSGICLYAYTQECGTQVDSLTVDLHRKYIPISKYYKNSSTIYLPLKIHITGTNEGQDYADTNKVLELICRLNNDFAATGMQFFVKGSINYINNSNYHYIDNILVGGDGYQMMINNNDHDKINIYFTSGIKGNFGYFSGKGQAIVLDRNVYTNRPTAISHEMGHYFVLLHTFETMFGIEFIDGSNCQTAGDLFCSTEADFINLNWKCPYTGNQKDVHGDIYQMDGSNMMSYSWCRNQFTQEQIDFMLNVLNTVPERAVLLNNAISNISLLEIPVAAFPVDQSDVPYLFSNFSWEVVPDVTIYHLQISTTNDFAELYIDTFSTSEQISLSLEKNSTYFWRVKALGSATVCSDYSESYYFETNESEGWPLGFDNSYENTIINISPNMLLITFEDQKPDIYPTIYNLQGQIVDQFEFNDKSVFIDISQLPRGMYLLKFDKIHGLKFFK